MLLARRRAACGVAHGRWRDARLPRQRTRGERSKKEGVSHFPPDVFFFYGSVHITERKSYILYSKAPRRFEIACVFFPFHGK